MSLDYLLRRTIECGAKLYSPAKEAYGMLKEAIVEGKAWSLRGIMKPA